MPLYHQKKCSYNGVNWYKVTLNGEVSISAASTNMIYAYQAQIKGIEMVSLAEFVKKQGVLKERDLV